MNKTLVLYESRYGFTEAIAKNLSLILGPSKYCKSSELKKDDYEDFSNIVVCTPVYLESMDKNLLECILENADWIKEKKYS